MSKNKVGLDYYGSSAVIFDFSEIPDSDFELILD